MIRVISASIADRFVLVQNLRLKWLKKDMLPIFCQQWILFTTINQIRSSADEEERVMQLHIKISF